MTRLNTYQIYLLMRFVRMLFFAMIATYTTLYRINIVGLNPLQLVLVGTVLEVVTFLFEVPTGVVADVVSRKLSVVIGVILIGIGFFIESLIPEFAVVLIAQVIWGIGFTFISGAQEAWISGEIGEEMSNKAYVHGSQWMQAGAIIGTIISIPLATINVRLPIMIGALLHTLWGIVLFFVMPEKHFVPAKPDEMSTWQHAKNTFMSGYRTIRINSYLSLIVVAAGIYGMFSEGFDRLWTAYMVNYVAFPTFLSLTIEVWIGVISVTTIICTYIGLAVVKRAVNTNDARAVTAAFWYMLIVIFVAAIFYSQSTQFPMAVGLLWLIFTLRESTGPLYQSVLNKNSEQHHKATVFSIASQSNALGQIAGGPILGFIATTISLRAGLESTALALIPTLSLFYLARRKQKHI